MLQAIESADLPTPANTKLFGSAPIANARAPPGIRRCASVDPADCLRPPPALFFVPGAAPGAKRYPRMSISPRSLVSLAGASRSLFSAAALVPTPQTQRGLSVLLTSALHPPSTWSRPNPISYQTILKFVSYTPHAISICRVYSPIRYRGLLVFHLNSDVSSHHLSLPNPSLSTQTST